MGEAYATAMLDLKLFRKRAFASSSTVLALASFALFGMLFFVPQYLQFVLGASALGAGMRLLPLVAAMAVGAPLSGPLVGRFGTKLVVGGGLLLVFGALQRVALRMDDGASSSNESIFARSQGKDSRCRKRRDVQSGGCSHLRGGSSLR